MKEHPEQPNAKPWPDWTAKPQTKPQHTQAPIGVIATSYGTAPIYLSDLDEDMQAIIRAGLNPDALPALIAAAENLLDALEEGDDAYLGTNLRAALAKVKS